MLKIRSRQTHSDARSSHPAYARLGTLCLAASFLLSGCQNPPMKVAAVNELSGNLRPVDGGAAYYGQFANPLPTTDDYFPVGVWLESIVEEANVNADLESGLNTYVNLTSDSNLSLLTGKKLYALTNEPSPLSSGVVLADEPDMWAGAGRAKWTGNWPGQGPICADGTVGCGYTLQQQLASGLAGSTMAYANYGKGVTFWEKDAEAAVFVNDFQDVVSADNYWFTDPNICGASEGGAKTTDGRTLSTAECRLAANYGWTVDRLRSLIMPQRSKPVWAFVEVGVPFSNSPAAITGPEVRAAVWSSIIHGARGIIYFNHSFGGDCPSPHVLRECRTDKWTTIRDLNLQLARLAPVLNAPFLDNALTHSVGVDAAVKVYGGAIYIIAGSAQAGQQQAAFQLSCMPNAGGAAAVTVLDENRTVDMNNGAFTDKFADGNAVHVYKIDGTGSCVP
jgi:hypothetical protein